jgi:hypothetical protein
LTPTPKDLASRPLTQPLVTDMKTCIKCNQEKELSEFYSTKRNRDGLDGRCKLCKNQYSRDQYFKTKDKRTIKIREWREANKERCREITLNWNQNNSERYKAYQKKYYEENKAAYVAKLAKYRASKLQATPLWADLEQIKRVYKACAKISERTGVEHHVDHIIPLQGKNVCGLHVEKNLAIISAKANLEKSNTFASWAID